MPLSSGFEGGIIRDEAAAAVAGHFSILGLDLNMIFLQALAE